MSFSGRKYQTNPVTFVPGDMAIWRYANDILKAVMIQSVCPPSLILPGYWYSFKLLTNENTMHDTWHSNLFIPVLDDNMIVDKKGIFDFREELFTMKDYLSKNMNPLLPSERLLHFSTVTSDGFLTKQLLTGSSILTIVTDDIGAFTSFWSSLNIQFTASTKPNMQHLPTFGDLSPIVPLRNQVYPPTRFGDSLKIKTFLDYVGTLVLVVLERLTLTTTAPRTHSHIVDVLHSDFDG